MVKVANDAPRRDGDLPAAPPPSRAPRPVPEVSGISLRLIAGLAATAQGSVPASPDASTPPSTAPCRCARPSGAPPTPPNHRAALAHYLVLADAASLHEITTAGPPVPELPPLPRQRGAGPAAVVEALHHAGAAGLVVSGPDPAAYRLLVEAATRIGLPLIEVPEGRLGPSRPRC